MSIGQRGQAEAMHLKDTARRVSIEEVPPQQSLAQIQHAAVSHEITAVEPEFRTVDTQPEPHPIGRSGQLRDGAGGIGIEDAGDKRGRIGESAPFGQRPAGADIAVG
jgi:hypothetical protein